MTAKKRVLLKLTGELFLATDTKKITAGPINHIIEQLKQLHTSYDFGIVIGGGNFFRGKQHGTTLGLTPSAGHQIGMLATMMNGLIIKDIAEQHHLPVTLLSALTCPEVGQPITQQHIDDAYANNTIVVFTGGTGNPFFTTDTSAILRGLQIKADVVWKGTHVDGVFTADPHTHPTATLLSRVSYAQAIEQRYGIFDMTAFVLGAENALPLRIFNIRTPDALLRAAEDPAFGTTII